GSLARESRAGDRPAVFGTGPGAGPTCLDLACDVAVAGPRGGGAPGKEGPVIVRTVIPSDMSGHTSTEPRKERNMASRFFPLYNIDKPVGPGKPNLPDDVRLVQALFIEVSRFDAFDWVQDIPPQSRTLTTSGVWDDNLKEWILALQRWAFKG